MGSLCDKEKQICPIHPNEAIIYLCTDSRCIEPLCGKCLDLHYQQHKEIGAAPNIQQLKTVKDSLLRSMKFQAFAYAETQQLNQSVRQIYPAEYVKQLTREYFIRKRSLIDSQSGLCIQKLISNVEASHLIIKDPSIRQSYFTFLKDNTKANMGVLSEEYSHLY